MLRVWVDHQAQRVEIDYNDERPHGGVLRLAIDPRSLHQVVRDELGPPPDRLSAADMEFAITEQLQHGRHARKLESPREAYRAAGIVVVQRYVRHHLRGVEVPAEAAEALLDMKAWRA